MSSSLDRAVRDLMEAIQESQNKRTKSFDTPAEVVRIDGDTAWVHFPGGVDETPVKLTVDAKPGDIVQVRGGGGQAWLVGNASSPPTDDATAIHATRIATGADEKASSAIDNANLAKLAADLAETAAAQAVEDADKASKAAAQAKQTTDEINAYAETVDKTVTQILNDGETAGTAAQQANLAATGALNGLAMVEDVVGTLNWIAKHATFTATEDTEVVPGKTYYQFFDGDPDAEISYPFDETTKTVYGITFTDNGDGTITANGTATGTAEFLIKRVVNRTLILSAGTYRFTCTPEGGSLQTYYTFMNHYSAEAGGNVNYGNDTGVGLDFTVEDDNTRCGAFIRIMSGTTVDNLIFKPELSVGYLPVINPSGDPHAQGWYEASVKEAVSNYIAAHLALTEEGLFLTMDDNGYKLKLTSQGAYIVDPTLATVAEYSDQTIIGDARFRNVLIDNDSVDIRLAAEVLASFGETVLIGKSNAQRVEIKDDATKFFDASGALTAEIAQGQTTGVKFVEQNIASGTVLDDTNGVTFELSAIPKRDNGHGLVVDVNICEDHARIWFESWTSGQVKTLTRNNITAVFDSSANTVKLTHSGTKENVTQKEISTAGSSFTHTLAHDPAPNSTAIITVRSTKYGSAWHIFRNVDLTQDVSDYYGQFRFTYSAATKTFSAVNDQGVSCYIEIDYVAEASVVGANSYIRFSIVGVVPNYTFGNRTEMDANQSPYTRGARSFAAGFGLVAESENQVVFGQYNDNDQNNVLEIGNGTSDTDRSNAFEIKLDGTANICNSDFEKDSGGSLNDGLCFIDANGESIAYMKALSTIDSQDRTIEGFNVGTSRTVNGSVKWNSLRLMIDADGNPVVTTGQPKAWREALELETVSASCTIASGWTNYTSGNGPVVYKSGNVVTFIWQCKPTASKLIDANLYDVCTIPSGYRPPRQILTLCQSTATRIFELRIRPDGGVSVSRLRNTNSTSYDTATTSYWFPLFMTYVIP